MPPNSSFSTESSLFQPITSIFNDCQLSAANHRRNCIALHKLHTSTPSLEWETAFFFQFFNCVAICLDIRKNEEISQRICKFINAYCAYSKEKDTQGVHSRFIDNLIACLLHGCESKDKQVRQRVCQLLGGTLAAVDELRSELLTQFITLLTNRLYDKEASVRIASLEAVSRLQDLDASIKGAICQLLQFDCAVEVRKAALIAINIDESSLDLIIARTQDENSSLRKLWFRKKSLEIPLSLLSIRQRETILKNGLFDRDPDVKEACVEMIFNLWLPQTSSNIIQFLDSLDIISNTQIALEALKGFFEKYPKLFSKFPEAYFQALTAETAFIMRSFCEFRLQNAEDGIEAVQELLPEVIQFATFLKSACETLLSCNSTTTSDTELLELEFIALQMFNIGKMLDYSDEVSRRFMISLLHDVLSVPNVPLGCIPEVVQFLFVLSPDPRERIGIFGEILMELVEENAASSSSLFLSSHKNSHLTLTSPNNSSEMCSVHPSRESSEVKEAFLLQQLKCLQILNEFIKESPALAFDQHPILAAFFNELVIPSINSPLAVIQEAGLEALGAYCLLYRPLALEYLGLVIDFLRMGHLEIRVIALKLLFDLELQFSLGQPAMESCFREALMMQEPELKAVAVEGVCKLLLSRPLEGTCDGGRDNEGFEFFISTLLLRYFEPEGAKYPKMRQCLAYFFSLYSTLNPLAIVPHFTSTLIRVVSTCTLDKTNLSPLEEPSARPLQIADQMLHWLIAPTPTNTAQSENSTPAQSTLAATLAQEILLSSFRLLAQGQKTLLRLFVGILSRLPPMDANAAASGDLKRVDWLAAALLRKVGSSSLAADKTISGGLRKYIASYVEFDDRSVQLPASEIVRLNAAVDRALEV